MFVHQWCRGEKKLGEALLVSEPEPVKKTQTKNKLAGGGFEPLSPDSVSGMLTTAPTRHYYAISRQSAAVAVATTRRIICIHTET